MVSIEIELKMNRIAWMQLYTQVHRKKHADVHWFRQQSQLFALILLLSHLSWPLTLAAY
jgi:hypothetical protein